MSDKYLNRYRIPSARKQNWDYTSKGLYFITICTKNRKPHFGTIKQQQLYLNPIGCIAYEKWKQLPHHHPNILLSEFCVMPNHVHGIIEILDTVSLETRQRLENNPMSQIAPQAGSISTIIRSYKSSVTKEARVIDSNFVWQPRFHDHVIKDRKSHQCISMYISDNVQRWDNDCYYC